MPELLGPPVFVGGTGRSGTTIAARILGSHSDLHMIPVEVRFIVGPDGICDLVAGVGDFDRFRRRILGTWWQREAPDGGTRGLHKILGQQDLNDALEEFAASEVDATSARRFVHRMLDPIAERSGARRWVEMTPANVTRGKDLAEVFPEMGLVHVARDGRDVASSVAPLGWGPTDHLSALDWWGDAMVDAHRASQSLEPGTLFEMRMEDLVGETRDETVARLFDFAGERPDEGVRAFLDGLDEKRFHIGRWEDDVTPEDRPEFQLRYEQVLRRLEDEGLPLQAWKLG